MGTRATSSSILSSRSAVVSLAHGCVAGARLTVLGYRALGEPRLAARAGRRDLERLPDLQLAGIVDVVGRHQVFGLDAELLGNAGRVVAWLDDVRLLADGRARGRDGNRRSGGRRRRRTGQRGQAPPPGPPPGAQVHE